MFLQVALLSTPYGVLTYTALPEFPESFWKTGLRVAVPLGRSRHFRPGFITGTSRESSLPGNIQIRPVVWPLECTPLLRDDLVDLIQELQRRQGDEPGRIARAFLPADLRSTEILVRTDREQYSLAQLAHLSPDIRSDLAQELLQGRACMTMNPRLSADEEYLCLTCDPPWPVRPAALLQRKILDYLHTHGSTPRKTLRKNIQGSLSEPVRSLLARDLIQIRQEEPGEGGAEELLPPAVRPFTLNQDQQTAVRDLTERLERNTFSAVLLYGVTGSGKTAVYLELASRCLRLGRSVLLLVPEVAIALKLLKDARTLYPGLPVRLFHGYQPPTSRARLWQTLAGSGPTVVIGTRSALFLPLPRLGCIILDEEHDASFKQDEGFVYHAKEIAWFRALKNSAVLLLGSATPDVRTYHAARRGEIPLLTLPRRISGNPLPPIHLIDTRDPQKMSAAVALLHETSLSCLKETVSRGEQAVILINRRGYTPSMYCLDCGKTERCPLCEIALNYHKERGQLICHYCGYTKDYPSPCSTCGSGAFLPLGEGTERLAEELSIYLGEKVLRLDRDSTSRVGQMERILTSFAHEESHVLVGTQMLSKGHHFPRVTLVILADADMGLNFPDYRATERTFQLLLQAAGRAGRGELEGKVLLQTKDISHYCWKYVLSSDYEGFYGNEIGRRRQHHYPPFVRLALIRMSYPREDEDAHEELMTLARILPALAREHMIELLGPVPAPHAVLYGRKRFQCLLKAPSWQPIRELYVRALSAARPRRVRVMLDLDPVNML